MLLAMLVSMALAGEAQTDHDLVVGRTGVGFGGVQQVPLGPDAQVTAGVVSARRWLKPKLGIDVGLGLGYRGAAARQEIGSDTFEAKGGAGGAMALHAGVPLALAHSDHFTFLITPETRIGFGVGNVPAATEDTEKTSMSGFRADLGGRVGAEIQFGFMKMPRLALEGSVGGYLSFQSGWSKTGSDRSSSSSWSLSTMQVSTPWDIFGGFLAARYYL